MEDYSNDFSKFVQNAVDKAKELGGIAKLHAQIKAEEAKKQEQYYKLGKKYYELYKDAPEAELEEYINKLAACDEKIREYRKELKKEQNAGYRDVYKAAAPEEEAAKASEEESYDGVEEVTNNEKCDK